MVAGRLVGIEADKEHLVLADIVEELGSEPAPIGLPVAEHFVAHSEMPLSLAEPVLEATVSRLRCLEADMPLRPCQKQGLNRFAESTKEDCHQQPSSTKLFHLRCDQTGKLSKTFATGNLVLSAAR